VFLCSPFPVLCSLHGESNRLDPAAWGSDHVGKPLPEYVTGDECLFCHRSDIGPAWPKNRHNLTLRRLEPDSVALTALKDAPGLKEFAEKVELALGGKRHTRFLKPAAEYGKLELLSVAWEPTTEKGGRLLAMDRPHWDRQRFADGCAGCHATAVEVKTRAFSAIAVECYACHGEVDLKHSKDPALVFLSKKREDPARVVTSICAQCHLRTGKSRSTGLPYPNNFIAGDNLFRDFQVDLTPDAIRGLNPADGHVLANVREVVVEGKEDVTCLSCHAVHGQSSKKHHLAPKSDYCLHCHNATGPKKDVKRYEVHSRTCGY
jgi:hypothetical protein